jgi:hypothetical protein
VAVHADQHIGRQAQAELLAVQQRHLARDVAVVLQLLDPARAGEGDRPMRSASSWLEMRVALQFGKDAQVVAVEFAHE